jgi:malate dehydrogenase
MHKKCITVAITGAAGQIGYALLPRIASGQMFGPDVEIKLHLIELEATLPALHGLAMELDDCAFPLLKKIVCTSSLKEGMSGANWALLVGAVPRKEGMERSDLLKINGNIFITQGLAINNYAAPDIRVLVVGNPCNTNCLIAMHHAKDVPNDRFYAMTMLDELRARSQLAKKANVGVGHVSKMTIWGNHSSTQYPDFYHAQINHKPVLEKIHDEKWLQTEFISMVQQRGAAVIKARGSSSAASAANGILMSVYQISHETPAHETYSMAICSRGEYNVPEGLIFSYPCKTEQGQLKPILGLEHNPFGQAKLQATIDELKAERAAVTNLGLID